MKSISFNLVITILFALLQTQRCMAKYTPGINSLDFEKNKFSDLLIAEWQYEIYRALHLNTDRVDGQACIDNYFALMDQRNALYLNVSRTQGLIAKTDYTWYENLFLLQANTSLKLGEIASIQLADTIETCTTVGTESW